MTVFVFGGAGPIDITRPVPLGAVLCRPWCERVPPIVLGVRHAEGRSPAGR